MPWLWNWVPLVLIFGTHSEDRAFDFRPSLFQTDFSSLYSCSWRRKNLRYPISRLGDQIEVQGKIELWILQCRPCYLFTAIFVFLRSANPIFWNSKPSGTNCNFLKKYWWKFIRDTKCNFEVSSIKTDLVSKFPVENQLRGSGNCEIFFTNWGSLPVMLTIPLILKFWPRSILDRDHWTSKFNLLFSLFSPTGGIKS